MSQHRQIEQEVVNEHELPVLHMWGGTFQVSGSWENTDIS